MNSLMITIKKLLKRISIRYQNNKFTTKTYQFATNTLTIYYQNKLIQLETSEVMLPKIKSKDLYPSVTPNF